MILQIDKDYRITADSQQWVVQKYAGMQMDKRTGKKEPKWNALGYYASLGSAAKELHRYVVRTSDADTLADALLVAENTLVTLTRALEPRFKVVCE